MGIGVSGNRRCNWYYERRFFSFIGVLCLVVGLDFSVFSLLGWVVVLLFRMVGLICCDIGYG